MCALFRLIWRWDHKYKYKFKYYTNTNSFTQGASWDWKCAAHVRLIWRWDQTGKSEALGAEKVTTATLPGGGGTLLRPLCLFIPTCNDTTTTLYIQSHGSILWGKGDLSRPGSTGYVRLGCKPCKPCKLGEIRWPPRYKPEYKKLLFLPLLRFVAQMVTVLWNSSLVPILIEP